MSVFEVGALEPTDVDSVTDFEGDEWLPDSATGMWQCWPFECAWPELLESWAPVTATAKEED
ncbi:hypothetical protein [Amycolatopsis anabasis]|uniref:hypothetical protein n=1 Tax=Amycolatopsis anabasis TaxID=1840409 RepID=UPI001C552B55|nr:hypothetical protein [Amycolatopsis anabasis]